MWQVEADTLILRYLSLFRERNRSDLRRLRACKPLFEHAVGGHIPALGSFVGEGTIWESPWISVTMAFLCTRLHSNPYAERASIIWSQQFTQLREIAHGVELVHV